MKIYKVDSFTGQKFAGNPAGVCLLNQPADEHWMQNIAREMNLSETAFLVPQRNGFDIRWFTPAVEVDLCGHATLASAHILYETGNINPEQPIVFHSKSGFLKAEKKGDWINLDFPALNEEPTTFLPQHSAALGITATYAGLNQFDYIIEVESEKILREMSPNFQLLKAFTVRGFIITTKSETENYDFISRFFAPGAGIDEDPVTGSAHCCLAPYWSKKLGKNEMTAFQASPRGGVVRVSLQGDRVILGGQAVTILKGELV